MSRTHLTGGSVEHRAAFVIVAPWALEGSDSIVVLTSGRSTPIVHGVAYNAVYSCTGEIAVATVIGGAGLSTA